jgi:hypothetical protein
VYEHKINNNDNLQVEAMEAMRILFSKDETWGDFIKDVKQSNVYKYKEAVSRKFRSDRFKNIEELRIK